MNRMNQGIRRSPESGYNLIEVLVAMAMLGTVLIGIVTLFVMGQRNVYSGKQMTRAVAVATRVMEDFAPLTRVDIEDAFGLAAETPGSVSESGGPYANSVLRSSVTDAGDATKDADGYLTTWNEFLKQEDFTDGKIKLIITAVDPITTPTAFDDVPIYRIRLLVEWNEGTRERRVTMDTVKVDRTN